MARRAELGYRLTMDQTTQSKSSLWIGTADAEPYQPLEGEVTVDVAVVGAGIFGVTTALMLKRAGRSVALIEADRIGRGVTGRTTAKITSLHRLIYKTILDEYGQELGQMYARANERAIDQIEEFVGEYAISCDFSRLPFYSFAQKDSTRAQVEAEAEAALKLGLPAAFEENVPLPVRSNGAVCFLHQAQFHPVLYLDALAAEIGGGGSHVYERSRVVEINEGDPCRVTTTGGAVNARDVVIATHYPIAGKKDFYFARIYAERHYVVAAQLPEPFADAMFVSAEKLGYSYRAAPSDNGPLLILTVGDKHKTGQQEDARDYYRAGVEHAREAFGAETVDYRWSTQDTYTRDQVPYIGRLDSSTNHLYTATGFRGWGLTNATAGAQIVSDLIQGKKNPHANVFDPSRGKPLTSVGEFVKENVNVAKSFVAGYLAVPRDEIDELREGEGRVARVDGDLVGVSRGKDGTLRTVKPICPHLGCVVAWNKAEQSWDCPCHGSRFSAEGAVLHSPAMKPLEKIDLDSD